MGVVLQKDCMVIITLNILGRITSEFSVLRQVL